MKIRSQVGMVLNLDKCIGCHTCSVTCKNVWTSREGMEYAWFNNVETKPGYYLVRDQRWSRFTICRQFKAGSTGVDRRGRAKVAAGTELPFSFERFWLTVEMLWKLSLLLLPLAVSDEDHALKFVPGAVSTAIMLLCQLSFNPYISTRQNRCAALLYSVLLVLYILACIFHGLDQGTGGQKTVAVPCPPGAPTGRRPQRWRLPRRGPCC